MRNNKAKVFITATEMYEYPLNSLFIPLPWGALWWVCCPPPCAQVSVWNRWESWHLLSLSYALQKIQTLKMHNY